MPFDRRVIPPGAKVTRWLAPDAREYALAKAEFEAPEARAKAEAAILAARAPLLPSDVPRLLELLPQEAEDAALDEVAANIVEAVAGLLSDDHVARVLDTVQSWKDRAVVSRAVVALAPRIAPARIVELVTSSPWSLSTLEALLEPLPDTERGELAPSIFAAVMEEPSAASRALALTMLARLRLPGLDHTQIHEALEIALQAIDASAPSSVVSEMQTRTA